MAETRAKLKRWMKNALGRVGLTVARGPELVPDFYIRLRHMKRLGLDPMVIIDGGAFVGAWSMQVSALFPEARFVLVEPNPQVIERTRAAAASMRGDHVVIHAALSDKPGRGQLNIWERSPHRSRDMALQGSSLLPHVQGDGAGVDVDIQTLDAIAAEHSLTPDLVKLDLQGAELAALKGAAALLGKTELFIIEFGCLDAYVDRTTPRQLMDMMYDHGYSLYDIVDLGYRAYDGALSSGDFFFLANTSKLKSHKDYF